DRACCERRSQTTWNIEDQIARKPRRQPLDERLAVQIADGTHPRKMARHNVPRVERYGRLSKVRGLVPDEASDHQTSKPLRIIGFLWHFANGTVARVCSSDCQIDLPAGKVVQ